MTQTKTIKEYKTEELQQILIGTKDRILDFTESLQIENQNRQVIEKELVERQKEEESDELKQMKKVEEFEDVIKGDDMPSGTPDKVKKTK